VALVCVARHRLTLPDLEYGARATSLFDLDFRWAKPKAER